MAERIDTIVPSRPGRPAVYPWAEWMDGSAWRISRGEDFSILPDNMGRHLREHARRQGVPVQVSVNNSTDTIEFRFETRAAA